MTETSDAHALKPADRVEDLGDYRREQFRYNEVSGAESHHKDLLRILRNVALIPSCCQTDNHDDGDGKHNPE